MRNKIVKRALEIVGKSRDELNMSGSYAWCAHTVSEVLKYVGIDMYDLSCNSMKSKMSASSDWDEPESYPEPGDIIFFDWDREKDPEYKTRPLDHVGIVVSFNENTGIVNYVNGNGNSDTHVTRQNINVSNPSVAYWMRYVGDNIDVPQDPQPTQDNEFSITFRVLKKGCKGNDVKSLQQLLFAKGYACGADDGDFGPKTENSVKDFQGQNKLDIDGIAGNNTIKKLWGY